MSNRLSRLYNEQAKDCSDIADSIANKLSELEIHRAKKEAEKRAGVQSRGGVRGYLTTT